MKLIFERRSRFRRLGQIGQGQFGRVYFAIERQTGKLAALKDLSLQKISTDRLLRELTYLVTLQHPNLISFLSLEHHRGGRYLVTDYCEAGTLRDLLDTEGTLNPVHALKIVADVLLGLAHAHQRHIIHCDIKPENILLSLSDRGWKARLSDFGIARLGQETGMPNIGKGYTGSPAYMAPERHYGKFPPASDLYSVGIVLYEAIVGDRPFHGLPNALMTAHLSQRPEIPDSLPPILRSTLDRALQKLPQKRFSSAGEMFQSVRQAGRAMADEYGLKLWLAPPPPLPSSPQIVIDWECRLSAPIKQLAIAGHRLYWGSDRRLGCLNLKDLTASPEKSLLPSETLVALQARATGCWVTTQSSRGLALYAWPETDTVLSRPLLAIAGQASPPIVNPSGEWCASVDRVVTFKNPRSIPLSDPPLRPSHLLAIDRRHGLILRCQRRLPRQRTDFYLFNRRGSVVRSFSLPIYLDSVAISLPNASSPALLGIEKGDPTQAIAIGLLPLKVTRSPLNLTPDFIAAFSWGFCLVDRRGRGLLLDFRGTRLAEFETGAEVSAIASCGDAQLDFHLITATAIGDSTQLSLWNFGDAIIN